MGRVFLNKLTAPREPIYENLSATIAAADWEASEFTNIIKNDVTFGGVIISELTNDYAFAFNTNEVVANDFANLPAQQMVFNSDSTTGPITLTKQGDGAFTEKFIGSLLRVFTSTGPIFYTITALVDSNNLTVRYQPNPSQGRVLESLTNEFGGPNSNMQFLFVSLNGTPDPNVQTIQSGFYDEQTEQSYSFPNVVKSGAMQASYNVPANATIASFAELAPNVPGVPDGFRYFALILDDEAFVMNSTGVRKIAKIENGNSFMNTDPNFLSETWQQIGGDIKFSTVVALDQITTNRVLSTDMAQATQFPSLQGKSQLSFAVGLAVADAGAVARTQGARLTFDVQVVDTSVGFNDTNFITLELNMDDGDLSNFGAIKAAWNNGVAYYEVIEPNVIRFYSGFTANEFTVDVPLQVKVIK